MSETTQESNSLPETQLSTPQEVIPVPEPVLPAPVLITDVQVQPTVSQEEVKPIVQAVNNVEEIKTVITNVPDDKPKNEEPSVKAKNTISAEDIEKFKKEGIDILIEKYLDDGIIDNEELIDLVQTAMEIAEQKTVLSGPEKKSVVIAVLRSFLETRVTNYPQLEILISKSIDLAVNVTKNGLSEIKFSSETISQSKSAFNLIYENTMSKIEEKYPLTDDIINNIFDIALSDQQIHQ